MMIPDQRFESLLKFLEEEANNVGIEREHGRMLQEF